MQEAAPDVSSVTPLGFLFLVCMGALTWRLPRRSALIPLLITTCYMPLGQMLVIGGLHFPFLRLLLLLGFVRAWTRREHAGLTATRLDKLFIYWSIATLVLGTLADISMDRFVNRSGQVYTAAGVYFLVRCWIRELDDVIHSVRFIAFMIIPLAVSMLVEKFTTHNIFAVFGGVPEVTLERDGRLRCQGAFRHPILAGTYGATLFPLFAGLWLMGGRDNKRAGTIGLCCSAVVTLAASSSGAMLAMMAATAGLACWKLRDRMRLVRRGTVLAIIALALIMNAPVYYSLARLSEIAGGTGWYRSYLIDQAIKHFDEWWLVGSTYTAHWAPAGEVVPSDPNNMDIINHYVAEGLGGGVVKLGLFIAMIAMSFKAVGRWTANSQDKPAPARIFIWSLGVCLFAHCISFFSVTYFDQIIVMWYWLLALMSMILVAPALATVAQPVMEGGLSGPQPHSTDPTEPPGDALDSSAVI